MKNLFRKKENLLKEKLNKEIMKRVSELFDLNGDLKEPNKIIFTDDLGFRKFGRELYGYVKSDDNLNASYIRIDNKSELFELFEIYCDICKHNQEIKKQK